MRYALIGALALAGCIGEDKDEGGEMQGSEKCTPEAFEFLVGQSVDALEGITTPETVRILEEGGVATTDHRPERLNVVQKDGKITSVSCG